MKEDNTEQKLLLFKPPPHPLQWPKLRQASLLPLRHRRRALPFYVPPSLLEWDQSR